VASKRAAPPLGGDSEFDTPDLAAEDADENPVIPSDAHIRLASPESYGGIRILRRGYSGTDGIDPVRGTPLGGLFFNGFVKNPAHFVALQTRLGTDDAPNE
jgi:deferrochelatase/peroxidase EfeB